MTRTRIAIIGAKHPHVFPRIELALANSGRCELAGFYDSEPRTLDHVRDRYGIQVTDDPEQALRNADAAIVEGFDHENPGLAELAVSRGKAVLLEKPGAPTVDAMRQLVERCAAYPVHVTVAYMLQSSPVIPHLEKIIGCGVLGPVPLARFHAATPVGCSAEIWQSLPEDEGGLLWTDGCHLMRTIVGLLGRPTTVTSLVRKLPRGPRVVADFYKPDLYAGLGAEHDFEIGGLVHEDVGAAILNYRDKIVVFDITGWEAHGWVEKWRVELWGADATLEAGLMPPWYRLETRRDHPLFGRGVHEQRMPGPKTAETSLVVDESYAREFGNFLDAVEQGSPDQSGLRAGLDVLETLHAIYESSRLSTPVAVNAGAVGENAAAADVPGETACA